MGLGSGEFTMSEGDGMVIVSAIGGGRAGRNAVSPA